MGPMGDPSAVEEFREELSALEQKHGHSPKDELRALALMSLEREQIARVSYGGGAVATRVRSLRASDEIRRLFEFALRWAGRDESMHSVWTRGALVSHLASGFGRGLLDVEMWASQLGGVVGGWASAVVAHTTWRSAPIARLVARSVAFVGGVLGKVPGAARRALARPGLLPFCEFQIEAEHTAVMAWSRVAALSTRLDRPEDASVAERVMHDEEKHARMFETFVDVLGLPLGAVGDAAAEEVRCSAEELVTRLRSIDASFVPAAFRDSTSPIGRGGIVAVSEDVGDAEDARGTLRTALASSGVLDALGGSIAGARVAVKTCFMMTYDRRDKSPHVRADLLDELVSLLLGRGAREVVVLEAPNHFDRFFEHRDVATIARYAGLDLGPWTIVDASADQVPHRYRRGIGQSTLARAWRDADVRISFGKMRTHPSWLVHLTLDTVECLGKRIEELLFLERGADLVTGTMMILDSAPPDFAILDAYSDVPDGVTSILGTSDARSPRRVYAARDALALDIVAARHMGVHAFPTPSSISTALDWFDDPRPRTTVVGTDRPIERFTSPHADDLRVALTTLAYPVYAYGSGRGAWWVPAMDPAAFPERDEASAVKRLRDRGVRATLRTVFRFGNPR